MDLKKSEKSVLEAIESGAASIENLIEQTGYTERTVKSALNKLQEAGLVDDNLQPIKKELPNPEEWNVGAGPTEESVEEFDGDEIRLPHLRKMDFLSIQEGDGFTFHNKNWVVESVIEQKAIAGKPFLKMIAGHDEKKVEFIVNLGRPKAPISIKEFEQ